MIGTINCIYETPCGWCSKWDKRCDRKIGCNSTKTNNTKKKDNPALSVVTPKMPIKRGYPDW